MVPAPHSLGATSIPSGVHLSLWQAGWLGHLPVCVLLVCLCLGEVSRGPSPRGPRSVYAEAPKLALCPCVLALWFCLCVRVCVSWCCGPCVSVQVWLCSGPSESAPSLCPFGGLCPSLCWCCALALPEREGLHCSSTNKLVSHCVFQRLC